MRLKELLRKLVQTKVLENYSMMTLGNILGVLIGFAIYPYAIRVLGKDNYGSYVYAMAVLGFVQMVVNYGFDTPCAKMVVERKDDREALSSVVSSVLTVKMLLFVLSSAVLIVVASFFGEALGGLPLLAWGLLYVVGDILFPSWYFQGMKRMKVVTFINVSVRLLALPSIFLLVRSESDTVLFMAVNSSFAAFGGVVSVVWLTRVEGLRLRLCSVGEVRPVVASATHFFLANIATNLRDYSADILVGRVFGMSDLALFDLAHKIVRAPRLFTLNINGALFPELVDRSTPELVRRALRYEALVGLAMVAAVALVGWPAVMLLGGEEMAGAYPIAVCLSGTIPAWLVIGCYMNFVFVANDRYSLVTQEQVFALVSFLLLFLVGVLAWGDVIVAPLSIVLGAASEIVFCEYVSRRKRLL